jgi:thiol-disulfide isomerase/thioredoxin
MRKLALPALVLLAACRPVDSEAPAAGAVLSAEGPVPEPLLAGQSSFAETTRDRVTLVDFWATWCEACTESIPRVRHLADTYAGEDLVVVGVNVGEEPAQVQRYADEAELRYPLFLDPQFAFADSVGAREIPTLFVLDRSGRIVHRARDLDRTTLERLEQAMAAE